MTDYTDFHTLYNLTTTDASAERTEALIDLAINMVNGEQNLGITNMAGATGAKTVTLSSAQQGVIFQVAWAVYHSTNPDTASAAGASDIPTVPITSQTFLNWVHRISKRLVTRSFQRT